MLLPKRVKYRRVHRGRLKGKAYRGNKVTYDDSLYKERRSGLDQDLP